MSHRYFSSERIAGSHVTLAGSEAHHLLHVLRAKVDMPVELFDGTGAEFDAKVAALGRSTVELAVQQRREVDRELPHPLTLGVPLPKGDRQRWIVEKAVELGVTRLVPLHTARSIAAGDKAADKLDRYVIEASKQCGRNRLMEIAAPHTWSQWLRAPDDAGARRLIADPTGQSVTSLGDRSQCPTWAAVGPEGGLTPEELTAARMAGWDITSLGPRILRIETAALALAALLTTSGS
jgi:16S rRNA (uracil1498-N3)-methyltransferase